MISTLTLSGAADITYGLKTGTCGEKKKKGDKEEN